MPLSRSRAADRRWIAVVAGGLCGVAAIVGFGLSASADDGGSLSLKPGDSVVVEQTRPMGSSGIAVADHTPEACRDDPTAAQSCDVYRVHFEIDTNPDAFNFARFQADFDTPTTPGLPLPTPSALPSLPGVPLPLPSFPSNPLSGFNFLIEGALR
jgi:hypothetical protein